MLLEAYNNSLLLSKNIDFFLVVNLYNINYTFFNLNFINSLYFNNSLIAYFYCFSDFFTYNNFSSNLLNFDSAAGVNLENMRGIYHYTIPTTKLYYPEPFIAMPSFLHYDPWFFHILIYQYWLWFLFTFLVVFFFIIFLCTLRWCNPRLKPKRETRGVSRSKCGDLITATVPVTWATSIIIHESTDAIDLYDGFGTTEVAIGIRAFQWGWEYYYPKDLDLSYNLKSNNSFFFGKSLKYNNATSTHSDTLKFWRLYQLKESDQIVNPIQFLLFSTNSNSILNGLDFNNLGKSTLVEVNAFKKIYYASNLKKFHISKNLSFNNFNQSVFKRFYENESLNSINSEKSSSLLSTNSMFNLSLNFSDYKSFFQNTTNLTNSKINSFSFIISNFLNYSDLDLWALLQSNKFSNNLSRFFGCDQYQLLLKNYHWLSFLNNQSFQTNKASKLSNVFNKNNFKFYNTPYKINTFFDKFFITTDVEIAQFDKLKLVFMKELKDDEWLKSENFIRNIKNKNLNKSNFNIALFNDANNYKTLYSEFNKNSLNYLSKSNLLNKVNSEFFISGYKNPIPTKNPFFTLNDYDNFNKPFYSENEAFLFIGDNEALPSNLHNSGFNANYFSSGKNLRVYSNLIYLLKTLNYTWPFSFLYADYDFRRWQSSEVLEDLFWESTLSSLNYYDYLYIKTTFNDYFFASKFTTYDLKKFLIFERNDVKKNFKYDVLEKPYFKDTTTLNKIYLLPLYSDETVINYPNLLKNKFFYFLKNSELVLNLEDSYDSYKFLYYNSYFLLNHFTYLALPFNQPVSILTAFDTFRNNFENSNILFDMPNPNFFNLESYEGILLNFNNNTINTNSQYNILYTVKNINNTYNALQKIFRTKIDEMRSHIKLSDYYLSKHKVPFINSNKAPYKELVGKNLNAFVNTQIFKSNLYLPTNKYYFIDNINNTYLYDYPFLLSVKSDAGRYIWSDWQSKWNLKETQASSLAKYGMYGMPVLNKIFDFGTVDKEEYKDSEGYTSRISHSRKNYLNSWMFVPYNYAKLNNWFSENNLSTFINNDFNTINSTFILFKFSRYFWERDNFYNNDNYLFFASQSGSTTTGRNFINTLDYWGSYQYYLNKLVDILTKREYLLRQLYEQNNLIFNLPNSYIASPNNSLFKTLKSSFPYVDINLLGTEQSRINFSNNFKTNIFLFEFLHIFNLTGLYNSLNSVINTHLSLFNTNYTTLNQNQNTNSLLKKSQFKPMKKGIANMIKIHANGAIALPIEMRIQLLASSRDVIHSWAVPSAGVKIDCVPGYSSHRVITFILTGIYWGQCMEICGRYHHWMPIIVYFMKRDLFLLWSTHFIFLDEHNTNKDLAEMFYSDFNKNVSFSDNVWGIN